MNRLIEKTLENRGLSPEALKELNNPAHRMLQNADVLCEYLHDIYEAGEQIVILPDFDMDGIMSGVVGYAGMTELGFDVSLFIPDPSKGYGFTAETIDSLAAMHPNAYAIITCDVGITCQEGIDRATELGINVFVTDHHSAKAPPENAVVAVDPMLPSDEYEHPYICGAHVFWQILMRYAATYCDKAMQNKIALLRVFAGIGTISDSMNLWYENRVLVRNSVSICQKLYQEGSAGTLTQSIQGTEMYCRAFRGLYAALNLFVQSGKISNPQNLNEEFFGYYLAPTFNSVKRLNSDMRVAFGVFFDDDPLPGLQKLVELNEERKRLLDVYSTRISKSEQPYSPYIYLTEAQTGIAGLLAMRIMVQTGLPAVVLQKDENGVYNGSGRSPEWYPFLSRTEVTGTYVAGHEGAFGIRVSSDEELQRLFAFLQADVAEVRANVEVQEKTPDFVISTSGDGDTDIDIPLFAEYINELASLRPFGKGFEAPYIELRIKGSDASWDTLGAKKQHLKLYLPNGFNVVCWNQADKLARRGDDQVSIFGQLEFNIWKNNVNVQFNGEVA